MVIREIEIWSVLGGGTLWMGDERGVNGRYALYKTPKLYDEGRSEHSVLTATSER
jgi:hypothetical protein